MKRSRHRSSLIAVFDVDRTLIIGTSIEIQLVRYLLKKKLLPSANLIRALFWIPRLISKGFKEAFLRNKFYLYGLEAEFIRSLLPEFFEHQLKPLLSTKITENIKKLKRRGFSIILISGTLDFIVDFLITKLGADGGLGTGVEIKDGVFTGKVRGVYPFLHDKVTALKMVLDGTEVDYQASYGFADSWADVPLLSLFGNPVAMNPDWGLKKEAIRRGWQIEIESQKHRLGRN